MAATTNRRAARERLLALAKAQIDRLIPDDEAVPLKGKVFADFEDQADELERTLCPAFLEERVALDPNARVDVGGRCPHCATRSTSTSSGASRRSSCSRRTARCP
jgi:hypothetical protein